MATKDNEHFWRLYLYLNEGVSFLSKDIIVRKLDVSGKDLISQLRKHKVQLKQNDNLDSMDLDVLFPADGETNMNKWNANMYLSVILALFRASLKPKERTKLGTVQNVLEDLRKRQDGTKIDHLTYEEHVENLEEAFLVLSCTDDSVMTIDKIKKVYLDEPLNSDSLQNKIAKMEFPSSIKQKLEKFLETIYSTYTINENHFGTFKNTENSDKKHEGTGQDINFGEKQTEGAVVTNSIKDNTAEVESDEIEKKHENIGQDTDFDKNQTKGACATNEDSECATNEGSEWSTNGDSEYATNEDSECATNEDSECATNEDSECATNEDSECATNEDSECATNEDSECATKEDSECATNEDSECATKEDSECATNEDSECATNEDSEHSSDGIGSVAILGDVENKIVSYADKPLTDEEKGCVAQQLDMKRFEKSLRKDDLETFISETLNTWAKQHVNIAVIGRSGVGKSRLINAIRGCKEGDPEYAHTDVTEATMCVHKYPDPKNSLVVYWDLPGIGTENFSRRKYIKMKEINFFAYDLYLIVCAERFMEDDHYLAKTLEDNGKTFLFVRTKADVNDDEPNFKTNLVKMRNNCLVNLRSRNIQPKDVYLISSKKVDHKDLEFERLVNSLPDLKKEALLNSLRFNTKTLIMEKKTQLIRRAKTISTVSAAVGAVSLPDLTFCVDFNIIRNELDVYRNTLLITKNNLKILAEKTGIGVIELKSKYKLESFTLFKKRVIGTTHFLASVFKKIAMSNVAESTDKLKPVIDATIGAGISGYTTYKFLTAMLEILVQDAEKMLDILLEKTGSSIFQSD